MDYYVISLERSKSKLCDLKCLGTGDSVCTDIKGTGHTRSNRIMKEKTPLLHKFVFAFRCLIKGFRPELLYSCLSEKLPLAQKLLLLLEGAVSH